MSARLEKARRIAALRERRSERERHDAAQHARLSAHKSERADAYSQRCSSERNAAEQLLIADPSDPQAQLWRMLAKEQEQAAFEAREQAENILISATENATQARQAHERDCERTRLLEGRIKSASALEQRLAEEREAEEIQVHRS